MLCGSTLIYVLFGFVDDFAFIVIVRVTVKNCAFCGFKNKHTATTTTTTNNKNKDEKGTKTKTKRKKRKIKTWSQDERTYTQRKPAEKHNLKQTKLA